MRPETRAIHAAYEVDATTGALTPPIHLSTTFERDLDGEYSRGFKYVRNDNPNRRQLELRLAALENGVDALAFASGSVTMMTMFQALQAGDHVLVPQDMYFGIQVLLREILAPWGLRTSFVDMSHPQAVAAAMTDKTRLIVCETPSNPLLKLTDIAALADIAQASGAKLVVDSTIATPYFQQPFAHGADFVIHSATKFIGGHSDLLAGAIIANAESDFFERIRRIQQIGGAVADPFSSWLAQRGLMSFPARMQMMFANALKVATWLEDHPKIERVLYPALASHPQHELYQRQMTGASGLMSFQVVGGAEEAITMTNKLCIIKRMTSFGGARSKIEHRASIEEGTSTPQNLLRFSVGLEHPDDIIEDLAQALGG